MEFFSQSKSKKLNKVLSGFVLLMFFICSGQSLWASGYEFDGVGVAQVIKGGAVSADKGDWAHIYWNPAGIESNTHAGLELRPGAMNVKDGNSVKIGGAASSFERQHRSSAFIMGSGGAVVKLSDKDALGFGIYMPLMNGVDFKDTTSASPFYNSVDMKSFAGLLVGNISHSRKMCEKVSVGYGLNIINGMLDGETKVGMLAIPLVTPAGESKTKLSGSGYGLEGVLGIRYEHNDKLAFAGVFRTGSSVKIEGEGKSYFAGVLTEKSDFSFSLRQPATSSLGMVYKYDKTAKISADFSQTWWNGFSNKITFENPGTALANSPKTFDWQTALKFRLGFEKALSEKFSYMAGYAFDTPAIDKDSIDFSTAVDVPMHRFSAGAKNTFGDLDLTAGVLYGKGTRKAGGINYSLEGFFAMLGANYRF